MGPRGISYVPCRRTCSTIHHPMFHPGRHLGVKAKRPQSVKVHPEKKNLKHLDWGLTDIKQLVDVARINKSIAL